MIMPNEFLNDTVEILSFLKLWNDHFLAMSVQNNTKTHIIIIVYNSRSALIYIYTNNFQSHVRVKYHMFLHLSFASTETPNLKKCTHSLNMMLVIVHKKTKITHVLSISMLIC